MFSKRPYVSRAHRLGSMMVMLMFVLGILFPTIALADTNPFPSGWCTWGAWQTWHDHYGTGPARTILGNAYEWAGQARAAGMATGGTPAVNSIAVWQPGVGGAGGVGHVAYVTAVNSTTSFRVHEMNWTYGWNHWDDRNVTLASGISFIYGPAPAPSPPPARPTVVVDDKNYQPMGPSQWWRIVGGLGVNNEMTYTWNERYTMCNSAIWRPNLAGGNYEVFVFIPRNYANTTSARYMINAATLCGYRTVNQNNYYDQWVSIGTYNFSPGTSGYVYLSDLTAEAENSRMVGFDAVRFEPR